MTSFWGVQVKPKKPCKVEFDDLESCRLHLTQATLGSNVTKERTLLKCKVDDGPAVFICSLLPGVVETCSLDLYFREDVVFSVKGSNTVHLTGYYDPYDVVEDQSEEDYDEENSMDDGGDEESDDLSNEDQPMHFSKSGVKIEEIMDDESIEQLTGTLFRDNGDRETARGSNVVNLKHLESKSSNATIEDKNDQNGLIQSVKEDQTKICYSHKDSADELSGSSEDEDGFITCKRKPEGAGEEIPSKRRSLEVPVSETLGAQDKEEKITGAEKGTKKAKKKKKKKKDGKISLDHQDGLQLSQGNDIAEIISTEDACNKIRKEGHDASAIDGELKSSGKKGFVRKYPNGLEVENVSMGTPNGKQAKPGNKVGMIYIGKLKANGKIFDSNVGRKVFEFRLGVGSVIKGWDVGVNGMRVGDKRRLTIPPAMGYGLKGTPGIPPNSWLMFDVELVHVK